MSNIKYPYVDENDLVWFNENFIVYRWVEAKWSGRLKQYYVNKGYNFTKLNNKLIVDVRDLKSSSHVKVFVYCPIDMVSREARWGDVVNYNHTICQFHVNHVEIPIGTRIGMITVVKLLSNTRKNNGCVYLCRCDCGKEFEVRQAVLSTERIESCGCIGIQKLIEMSKSQVGENSPSWKGGHTSYRGPNWYEQREKVRKRDKNTCQRCGITKEENGKELDVHHIKSFREFGYVPGENENYLEANNLSNLICLCRKNGCHGIVEADYNRLFDFTT